MSNHSIGCDCPPCTQRAHEYTYFLGGVFGLLFIFGLFTIARAGLFAWVGF